MKRPISRRGFLRRATAAGGATLLEASLGPAGRAAVPPSMRAVGEDIVQAFQRQGDYEDLTRQPIFKAKIDPHWFGGGKRFWYRNDGPSGRREFVVADAVQGVRRPAFDAGKLAAGLGKVTGQTYHAESLPFETIAFTEDEKAVLFHADGRDWQCDLATYVCAPSAAAPVEAPNPHRGRRRERPEEADGPPPPDGASPDGHWKASLRDGNLWVRGTAEGATETALTKDGSEAQPYEAPRWSPDSRTLVAFRCRSVAIKPVYMVESSPKSESMRGVLHQHEYAQPGDPFPVREPWIFDPTTGKATTAAVDPIDFGEDPPDLTWSPDGRRFLYEKVERGHQRFRVIAVDIPTGQSKTIIDEQNSKTFIHTWNNYTYYTHDTSEIVYASEQDGWRHLYLYDAINGTLKNRITQGEWVVREIDRVDEEARQIWFRGSGRNAGENPYHLHFYRVNFDGSGLTALTEGDGTHTVEYSPDRAYLIDTYSRPDLPPVHTLRRTADGSHLCDLEKADISALTAAGWRAPDVFVAKGRDGKTDIWGVVFRPLHYDPKRRYPVIENIYAGPQDSFVRQSFAVHDGMQALAELGFIVVQCDGMGTRNRSKAFHDVCWRNLKDAGFPDRIAWIKAMASRFPAADTSRIGVYGTSAGGQSSTGALLFHPEFYKVGVSSCGCHDNRIDKRWWNEQWMGYPIGPWYENNSNITHAANLRGKLLLIVGELDSNVPPESTIRLTDALMKADKDFELLVITGSDHTSGGAYGERRRRDFFVRHLLGIEPPDRNAPKPTPKPVILKPRPLSDQALAQSDSGPDTSIRFHNRTTGPIELFWLSADSKRTSYGKIAPGDTREIHTYSGHFWLITDQHGDPIALYVGENRPGIAEVGG